MVNDLSQQLLDSIFHALSDPTRREILKRVSLGDLTVGEIARPYSISLPAISKHISVLEKAQLIRRTKRGRIQRISLNAEPFREALRNLEYYRQYFTNDFNSLKDIIPENIKRQ